MASDKRYYDYSWQINIFEHSLFSIPPSINKTNVLRRILLRPPRAVLACSTESQSSFLHFRSSLYHGEQSICRALLRSKPSAAWRIPQRLSPRSSLFVYFAIDRTTSFSSRHRAPGLPPPPKTPHSSQKRCRRSQPTPRSHPRKGCRAIRSRTALPVRGAPAVVALSGADAARGGALPCEARRARIAVRRRDLPLAVETFINADRRTLSAD